MNYARERVTYLFHEFSLGMSDYVYDLWRYENRGVIMWFSTKTKWTVDGRNVQSEAVGFYD